jgi:hypothetical protein
MRNRKIFYSTCSFTECFNSKVVLSMRNPPFKGDLPSTIKQVGSISEARSHSIVFECGDETECDILLLCTGSRL